MDGFNLVKGQGGSIVHVDQSVELAVWWGKYVVSFGIDILLKIIATRRREGGGGGEEKKLTPS